MIVKPKQLGRRWRGGTWEKIRGFLDVRGGNDGGRGGGEMDGMGEDMK